ncbi:ribonuclease H-like domain-containing protein [Tanacetum coccineum]
MLLLEESRLNRRDARSQTRHNDTPSSSTVLMATGPNPSKGTSWNSPGNLTSSQQPLNPAHIAAARQAQPAMSRVSFGYQPPTPRSGATQQSQPTPQAFGPSSILGPHPSTVASVPNNTTPGRWVFEPYGDQPSYLPQAFNAMSLQYPDPESGWYMDTMATSHLSAATDKLTTMFNKSIIPSIVVGNGETIPVTNSGCSILPSLHRPLYLQNVLVTPNIIKNLISVRQFTRDNKCCIDFDEYGFSVKDYWTRRLLLRCNSTGDLYPFLPSTISSPTTLLSTKHSMWHRRLGHPRDDVLRVLVSNKFISYNKPKSTTLCHACQLGKHVRLPFLHSTSVVLDTFDIIHSDLWTSPLPSFSSFKYYVIFLDHFSYFLWVYPLKKKSDAFNKFIAFCSYVKTQFNKEIKLGVNLTTPNNITFFKQMGYNSDSRVKKHPNKMESPRE